MGTALALTALLAAAQSPAPAQTTTTTPSSTSELPVSVDRVREGLQRPALKIPQIEVLPVFRESVEVDLPLDTPLQAMRRELAAESGYSGRRPNLIAAVMTVVNGIKAAYRTHKEAEIRERVQVELNAFCAEHDCSVLEDGPPPIEGVIIPRKRPTQ